MADGWLIALVGVGTATALTLLDKENLLFNMNPSKVWWWQRIIPQSGGATATTAQLQAELESYKRVEALRRRQQEEKERVTSKYIQTAQPNPGDWTQPKRGAY